MLPRDQCKDDILEAILRLNRARIHARLKTKNSLVLEGLRDILASMLKARSESGPFSTVATRLEILCNSLQGYCTRPETAQTPNEMKRFVIACYRFFDVTTDGESMKAMLRRAGIDVDESRGNPYLRQVGKIASYYHVADTLALVASHRVFRNLCINLSIQYVPAYKPVPPLMAAADRRSGDCRVHAEIQLIVELDMRQRSDWKGPRVIGSSKAACFLCELFINEHGEYFVPQTHGKLTPRWTIPDVGLFSTRQVEQYRNIIGAMDRELQRLAKIPHPRRPDPAMSWQALSQLNVALRLTASSHKTDSKLSLLQAIIANSPPVRPESDGNNSAIMELPAKGFVEINQEAGQPAKQLQTDAIIQAPASTTEEPSGSRSSHREGSGDGMKSRAIMGGNCCKSHSYPGSDKSQRSTNSPERRQHKQVRSFTDLDFGQLRRTARAMRDHESRTCDTPSECAIRPLSHSRMPHSDGISRRIDFHDMELFLEIEYPATAQIIVLRCSRPDNPKSQLIVEVDKLKAGKPLELDTNANLAEPRVMFLTKRDRTGIECWWECRWKARM